MFDAKSLLETLVRGATQSSGRGGQGGGGLGDLEGMFKQIFPQAGGQGQSSSSGQSSGGGGGFPDLSDLMRQMAPGGQGGQSSGSGGSSGGLGDIFGKMQEQGGKGAGDIADIFGQIFGQAKDGVREGAERINEKTGAGDQLQDMIRQMSGGRSYEEVMEQIKDFMANNKLGTGAALGGLGALVLGTQAGRSLATTAAKLGAMALIGGLAYKAYQNYSQGRPLVADNSYQPEEPPRGSGFEPDAVSNDQAALYVRAMIGAAAADGRIDAAEQQAILGNLGDGLDVDSQEFIAKQLNNPATARELASAVRTEEEAVQVFTAARIAIEPDSRAEAAFLNELASYMRLPEDLVRHVNAAARSAAA